MEMEELAFDLCYWFKRSLYKCKDFLALKEDTELDDSLFILNLQKRWHSLCFRKNSEKNGQYKEILFKNFSLRVQR